MCGGLDRHGAGCPWEPEPDEPPGCPGCAVPASGAHWLTCPNLLSDPAAWEAAWEAAPWSPGSDELRAWCESTWARHEQNEVDVPDEPDLFDPNEIARMAREGMTAEAATALLAHASRLDDNVRKLLRDSPAGGGVAWDVRQALERAEAKRIVDRLLRPPPAAPPAVVGLGALLAEPPESEKYRVDRLWPAGGRVVLAAQQKAGKTTLVGNLLRCLADGDSFLAEYDTEPVERIVLIDNELGRRTMREWLGDQGIRNTAAVSVLPLRGAMTSFDITTPEGRATWAKRIGPADVLVFDCLRPALDALGLSEDKDAGLFLEALDELAREAGIGEVLVVHHMGHSNERTRGDSRILDWPDAVWKLVREDPNDVRSQRYFTAHGRDVDQGEQALDYDTVTRRLVVGGGSRAAQYRRRVEQDVLDFLATAPDSSGREVEANVSAKREATRGALRDLISVGLVVVHPGPNRARLHSLAPTDEDQSDAI